MSKKYAHWRTFKFNKGGGMAVMKHYSTEQWADYVRGVASESVRAEMQRHLEQGCRKCDRALSVWTKVRKITQQESIYKPPDNAVRSAKSYFAIRGVEAKPSLVARVARLVFDS